jgi:hypothetical protein
MSRALIDLTDDQVADELRKVSTHVSFACNDLIAERDRRSNERQARASNRLALVTTLTSIVGVVIAVVAILRG